MSSKYLEWLESVHEDFGMYNKIMTLYRRVKDGYKPTEEQLEAYRRAKEYYESSTYENALLRHNKQFDPHSKMCIIEGEEVPVWFDLSLSKDL